MRDGTRTWKRDWALWTSVVVHLCFAVVLIISIWVYPARKEKKLHAVQVSLTQPGKKPSEPPKKPETPRAGKTSEPPKKPETPKSRKPSEKPKKPESSVPRKPSEKPQKPSEQPKKPDSVAERIRKARRVREAPAPGTRVPASSEEKNPEPAAAEDASSSYARAYEERSQAERAQDTASYADSVVRPYIYRNWHQPPSSQLDTRNVRPAEVAFDVSANGRISNVVFTRPSNSAVVNRSLRAFFNGIDHLPPLSEAGVRAGQLRIVVTISLSE